MTKYTPELLEALKGYTDDPKNHTILDHIITHGGIRRACAEEDIARRTVQRRLKALHEHAVKHGLNTEFPGASTLEDLPIFAKSRLIKHDPPLPDGTVLEWLKTKEKDYNLAQLIHHLCAGIAVTPAEPKGFLTPKLPEVVKSDILPIMVLADSHLGMLASGIETDQAWDLDKNIALVTEIVDYLVDKMDPCAQAVFVNLGDITHADGLKAVTPRSGHQVDVSHRYFDVARAAGKLMRYIIDRMLEKARNVTVYNIRGNHSETTEWHLNEMLYAVYEMEPRVKVPENDCPHQMFQWKDNMVVMTHGDAAKNARMYQYITTKWPVEFGQSKYIYCMKGHVHHTRVENLGNMLFETFATLSPGDAYHEHHMYKSLREMSMVLLEAGGGSAGRITKAPRR